MLTNNIKYNVTRQGDEWTLIGFVDVMDGDYLVFHRNLPTKAYDEFKDMTPEEIQALADSEASVILAEESAVLCISQYEDLKSKGLYVV